MSDDHNVSDDRSVSDDHSVSDDPSLETRRGSARDALAVPAFRRLYIASFISNAGRWMQTAVLGVLAWDISESSTFLGMVVFAQLGPLGILSLIGGSLADTADRRKLLFATQAWQMVWSFVLAALVIDGDISKPMLLLLVFIIGLGQGIYAPTFTSVLPSLAGEENLRASIALNSMQVNGARVVGPALGGWLASVLGIAEVFALNALTYVFVLAAIFMTEIPAVSAVTRSLSDRIFGGFKVARRAPQVGRPLLMMSLFSMFCLPFVGQLPALAELNLGIDSKSQQYGWFYAAFGVGALAGSALVATVLLRANQVHVVRGTLVGFAISLAWMASVHDINVGYIAVLAVGFFYLVLPTTLASLWQEHVDETVRGRIAALWVLAFGGTVPVAGLIAGPIIEATSLTTVLYAGSVAAVIMAVGFQLKAGPVVGESILN